MILMQTTRKEHDMESDRMNVHLLYEVLSDIFSEQFGLDITMRAIPKDEYYARERSVAAK